MVVIDFDSKQRESIELKLLNKFSIYNIYYLYDIIFLTHIFKVQSRKTIIAKF